MNAAFGNIPGPLTVLTKVNNSFLTLSLPVNELARAAAGATGLSKFVTFRSKKIVLVSNV